MIHLAQCLCPARHCIVAAAYDPATRTLGVEGLRAEVARIVDLGNADPWCGLCGAKRDSWTYEDGVTRWKTIEEARPFLEELEAAQQRAALALRARRAAERN